MRTGADDVDGDPDVWRRMKRMRREGFFEWL